MPDPLTRETITAALTEAGHVQAQPKPRRRSDPRQCAGFRVLSSPDGFIVTWATAGRKPFEASAHEVSLCLANVTTYAGVLEAAGYRVKVRSTRVWSTALILPAETTEGASQ